MTTRIKLRRDTAANWSSANPVLALGEPGYDTTNNKLKIGNGVTVWQDLDYLTDATGGGVSLPTDAAGYLLNDGQGNLSWEQVTANTGDFTFDGSEMTVPNGNYVSIYTNDSDGKLSGTMILDPGSYSASLAGRYPNSRSFSSDAWDTASWTILYGTPRLVFTQAGTLINFFEELSGKTEDFRFTFVANGQTYGPYSFSGTSYGSGNVTHTVDVYPDPNPTTVTSINYTWLDVGKVEINHESGTLYVDGGANLTVNVSSGQNVNIRAGLKDFNFDNTGKLHLPQGGDIVDSNGDSVLGGGTFNGTTSGLQLTGKIPTKIDLLGEDSTVWIRPANTENSVADIAPGIRLKRKNNQGAIYNAYNNTETQWNSSQSPVGTRWNADGWGDLADVQIRNYTTFYEACDQNVGEQVVGREFVMHDTINDQYFKVEFTYWQPNGGGGSNQIVNLKGGLTMVYTPITLTSVTYFVRGENDTSLGDTVGTGLTIKRGQNGGLYNSEAEAEWDPDNTPTGTLWNAEHKWHDFSDITGLTWKPLYAAVHGHLGNNLVGAKLLMHDTINNKYYTVKFTDWGVNNGGSFAYVRREILPSTGNRTGITFADGSFQDTATTLGDLHVADGNVIENLVHPGYGAEIRSDVKQNFLFDHNNHWTGTANWVTQGSDGRIQFTNDDANNSNQVYFRQFLGDLGRWYVKTVRINGGEPQIITGWGYDNIYVDNPPATNPTVVTDLWFDVVYRSRMYMGGENTVGFFLNDRDENFEVQSRDFNVYAHDDVRIQGRNYMEIRNSGNDVNNDYIQIVTDGENSNNTWRFTADGAINLPDPGTIRNTSGAANLVATDYAQLQWTTQTGAGEADPNGTQEPKSWIYVDGTGAYIETNINAQSGQSHGWDFTNDGNLILPNGGDIKDRNGNSVLGGSGSSPTVWVDQLYYDTTVNSAWSTLTPMAVVSTEYDSFGNIIALVANYATNGPAFTTVMKINSQGVILAQTEFADSVELDGWGLALDSGDSVYLCGQIDNGSNQDMFVSKLNSNLQEVWSKKLDGGNNEYGYVIDCGGDDHPVVVGTASFDSNAIYTVKLDKDTGNILWQRYLNNGESSTNESAWGMAVGTAGEVVAVGAGGGNFRQLIIKYDAGGTLQWQKEIILDDGLNCYAGDAEIDFDGNIYVLGAYEWGGGNQGISLTKLNGSGVAQWTRKVQGPCAAAAASIVMGDDGFLYISSTMGETVNDGFANIKLNQVLAKYNADTGTVVWQRYFKHASEWMLGANFFNQYGAGSNLAVKNGRFALGTTRLLAYFAGNQSDNKAILFQGATDGSEQTFGGFSFIASSLPGTLGSPFAVNNTNYSDNEGELSVSNWETGTEPGNISATFYGSGSATNELTNGQYSITLNSDGRLSLPNLDNTGWNYNYNLNGPTLKLGDSQNQVIITGPTPTNGNPNAQRIVIQGQRGYGEWDPVQPVAGEGGDVYIWGGVGGEGSSGGNYYGGSGGDIKIRGGQGTNNAGGYVKIEGGQAADFNGGSHTGGYVEIRGGDAVEGGNGNGGDVRIFGGKKQNTGNNGEVHISTGANEEFEWRFDNGGALNLATNANLSYVKSAGSIVLNADTKGWTFDTNGNISLPAGGDIYNSNGSSVLIQSQLVGNNGTPSTGLRTVVYANWQGYQGGESNGELFNSADVAGFAVGDHITFRNGEQRVITSFDTSYAPQVYVQWDASVDGAWNNPRYPAVFTTNDYLAETKKTARIKPDADTEGSGQYMDVYVGGAMVVDNKHVHMTGHHVDTELFLGSDSNFVSAKDAGNSPARVNLQSENDITVSETNLRMARGSNWANIHGDGVNRNFHGNTADLSWTAVESDEQGNFYVGGESHTGPNSATIAKYGPDGDLIWRKMIDNNNFAGWRIDGIAYNPVDKEVAFAVATDWDWDYDYTKIGVFDSETGELKTTTDLWDEDGDIRVTAMTWHPVLGYSVTGQNQGEVQSTSAIRTAYESVLLLTTAPGTPPQNELYINDVGIVPSVGDYFEYQTGTWTVTGVNTYSGYFGLVVNTNTTFGVPPAGGALVTLHHNSKSGVGYITIPSANAKIGGSWPVAWNNWFVSGTGINGNQLIQSGLGLFRDVPVTTVTGGGSGMTYNPRVVYYGSYYENYSQGTAGTGYNNGDQVKILGSLLGGVDGGIVYDATQTTYNNNVMYFNQATYPTLDTDVTAGVRVRFNNLGDATVTSVTDAGGGSWAVNITMNFGTQSNGTVTFYHGNDLTATAVTNQDLTNFAGVPALTNIRIDMGYDMGYGSTDFTGGTFTLSKTLDNRAFVWNTTWAKFVTSSQATYSTSIAVDRFDGGLIVGGTQDSTGRAYIWKMAQDGTTNWIKGVDTETGYHSPYGITVSAISGAIYYSDSVNSITKLGSGGGIIKRVQSNGAWSQYNPIIKLVQELDGEEYLYVGSNGSANWMNYNGFILNKLTSHLQLVWSRDIWNNNSHFNQHYGYFVNNFALGKDNAVLAGYGEAMSENYTNAILVSISIGDEFTNHQKNNWHLETSGSVAYQDHTVDVASFDFLTTGSVMTVQSSSVADEAGVQDQTWEKWGWKSVVVNLNASDNGIVGVESIKFANGGTLDHNPSDIPPAVTDFNNTGWNYILQLSDRGKFIINQPVPNNGYAQDIYITVPSNLNVDFPVGSVITLINTNDANNNGYKIYVEPQSYGGDDAPRIWAVDLGNQNPSRWSFQGMQIGRLMKIGSNEWLLDAKNIINED